MKITLDLPDDLHQQLLAEADRRGISLNELIVEALRLMLQQTPHTDPQNQAR
jgi:predicted HicB family RNase H-like nuclease